MAATNPDIFAGFQADYKKTQKVEMTVGEYLESCKNDKSFYANPQQRLLKAIGKPEKINYEKEPTLGRVFNNRPMFRYPAFKDFYGMEEAIKKLVAFLRAAAQGGEESKQILYLLGPVGGGKSSLAERIMRLMEQEPIYVLQSADGEMSPVCDSPLALFDKSKHGEMLEEKYGINSRNLDVPLSPWAVKRLKEYDGDITKFKVVKVYPSASQQLAISRVEAGDKNNMDVSTMTGKVNMSRLEDFAEHDPDAYGYNGGLNLGHQGAMEFVEMFKAPVPALSPLLTATQDRKFKGTQPIGVMPFKGLILAHSNESEWKKFIADKTNEAFIDRVFTIKVPYTLRRDEELKIYQKVVKGSELVDAHCAPHTLELLAEFAVMSRLYFKGKETPWSRKMQMDAYNGALMTGPQKKTLDEFRKAAYEAGHPEGMAGVSTRDAFKVLSATYNMHAEEDAEPSALPIDLMYLLEKQIKESDLANEVRDDRLSILQTIIKPEYAKMLKTEIDDATLESADYAQNIFEKYVRYADWSLEGESSFHDPDTNETVNREAIEKYLQSIEKPAGISNPRDFRNEITRWVSKYRDAHDRATPSWKEWEKFRSVIEKKIQLSEDELNALMTFDNKKSPEAEKKHSGFVERLVAKGYTRPQVRRIVNWYQENKLNLAA